jgi:hypothetical protein
MNHESIDRIRGDLATLKQAAGLDLPFGRQDVITNLWVAACGVLLGGWSALAPWDYRGFVYVPLVLMILGAAWSARKAHQNRGTCPSAWREHRIGIWGALIATPLVGLYLFWQRSLGMPRGAGGGAGLFFVGLALLIFALFDRRRLYYVAGAIPMMAWGIAVPMLPSHQVLVAGGICMLVGGLGAAAIQSVQLRRAKAADGSH